MTPSQFGLLGYPLGHSFSKSYFEKKFEELALPQYTYHLFEFPDLNNLKEKLSAYPHLKGFNITIPFKQTILPFCDQLSAEAKAIGAVNCIKIENAIWTGYNTDYFGFKQSIKPFLDPTHQMALVLGSGGSAKAVKYALESVGVEVYTVSSSLPASEKVLTYKDLNQHVFNAFKLIVNSTPLGMYPHIDQAPPIPYEYLNATHLCYDLIYNPEETRFLKEAKKQGAIAINGLSMLHLQAEKSWEIWASGTEENNK